MIVLDASAVFELVVGTRFADSLRLRLREGATVHVPHLVDVEVISALRAALRRGAIDRRSAARALRRLVRLAVDHYAHGPLVRRVWELRENLSAHDATYVALAERLGAPLYTRDARIALAPGIRARVELLAPVD